MAASHQTTLHPQADYDALARTELASGVRDGEPLEGSLDQLTLPALRDVLARHTETPDQCWFGLWRGFDPSPSDWASAPTFHLPGREYWLFTGPLASVVQLSLEFVAGTDSLIVDLLADPMIEALEVTSTTSLTAGADEINHMSAMNPVERE